VQPWVGSRRKPVGIEPYDQCAGGEVDFPIVNLDRVPAGVIGRVD